ncbi:MAG TPA: hypothetical protein VHX17_13695 [Candidatus Cybelea sp.]|nr:hypothetical protein [Candidatus Cybelea sp.]
MPERYSARIGAMGVAAGVPYDELVGRILELVLRAAIAVAADQFEWEDEELRRDGLMAIEFFHGGRALWWDAACFGAERPDPEQNELDPHFFERLDLDLRRRLKRAGYGVPPLLACSKALYAEIAADVADRCAGARESLLIEILSS